MNIPIPYQRGQILPIIYSHTLFYHFQNGHKKQNPDKNGRVCKYIAITYFIYPGILVHDLFPRSCPEWFVTSINFFNILFLMGRKIMIIFLKKNKFKKKYLWISDCFYASDIAHLCGYRHAINLTTLMLKGDFINNLATIFPYGLTCRHRTTDIKDTIIQSRLSRWNKHPINETRIPSRGVHR